MFRLSIKEIDDNGNERELVEGDGQYLTSLAVVGEIDDERCVEMLVNTSVKELSQMIAASDKHGKAAKLASVFLSLVDMSRDVRITSMEDMLSDKVEGGLQ